MISLDALRARDLRACARLMRWLDDGLPEARAILKQLYAGAGKAWLVGITGNPGAGKSTLVDHLIQKFRAQGKTVAVVAVDPSSPFSGGAILGDRIRMQQHALDEGVFIRSFATRGHLGGLASTTADVVRALDAIGWDVILVETVGVGQDEVEVQDLAHTTLVVMAPGMGDEIQAIKAGILEIADVFVVNKSDRDGADRTVRELQMMLDLGSSSLDADAETEAGSFGGAAPNPMRRLGPRGWRPRIVKTVGLTGEGLDKLVEAMGEHRQAYLEALKDESFCRARLRREFLEIFRRTLLQRGWSYLMHEDHIREIVEQLITHKNDPYTLAEQAVSALGRL